jgi:hypothetical protein
MTKNERATWKWQKILAVMNDRAHQAAVRWAPQPGALYHSSLKKNNQIFITLYTNFFSISHSINTLDVKFCTLYLM